jgi:F0F1-type ATP synthase alpha subunit
MSAARNWLEAIGLGQGLARALEEHLATPPHPRLFYKDQKPAVDVGKSVSRVGGKTQSPVLQTLSESLRLDYAQFLELEVFTRFDTMVDERTRKLIEHGRRIRAVLRQPQLLGTWLARHCLEALGLDDQTARLSEDLQRSLTAALKELARSVAGPPVGDRR